MSEFDKENEELENGEAEAQEPENTADDTVDAVEEAIEKAVEKGEVADAAQTVLKEGMNESFDADGIVEDEISVEYAVAESGLEDIPVRRGKGAVIAVIIAIVVALLAALGAGWWFVSRAPYNYLGYINVSGRTVQDIADLQGGSLADFLDAYSLPADMPASTDEAAAYYTIPTGVIAEMYGMDFDSFKTVLEIPDTVSSVSLRHKLISAVSGKFNVKAGSAIDENTPWGITEGEISLAAYVGEDALDSFKEEYGLGDEVTGETKWKEVRKAVDTAALEERKKAENIPGDASENDTDEAPEGEVPELSVDEVPSDEVPEAAPAADPAAAPAAE